MNQDVTLDFFLVGIGASAGGIQTLEEFFSNITDHPNAAFVVVQHLSPDCRSMMSEILQRKTSMQVRQVEDGMSVEPGTVYVMPPGKNMLLKHRKFVLVERSKHLNYPINLFFESMAQNFADRAIGVVLTGGGSDGTKGVQDISHYGGVVLAQDPKSAQFTSMPLSAIASGIVDKILSPKELALSIYDIIRFTYDQNPQGAADESFINQAALQEIISILADQADIDFSDYKTNTLRRRTRHRCALNHCETIDDYIHVLSESEDERRLLRQSLLIGATRFFRDGAPWTYLERHVLPDLIGNLQDGEHLRLWVSACSTGEEAYTLAIVVNEVLQATQRKLKVKIFTTDIDSQALSYAARGVYPQNISTDISAERLARYFDIVDDKYRVKRFLREMLIIAPHDLTKNAGFSKMHFVSCRNVLIYMKPKLQKQILRLLHFTLAPAGVLLLGNSESLGEYESDFEVIQAESKIYRKKKNGRRLLPHMNMRPSVTTLHPYRQAKQRQIREEKSIQAAFKHAFNDREATCLLVGRDNQLLKIFYNSANLVQLSVGEVQMNVVNMVPKELRMPLETAIHRAKREKEPVLYTGISLTTGDNVARSVDLRIGFDTDEPQSASLLVVVIEVTGVLQEQQSPSYEMSSDAAEQISNLEYELNQTKENLQVTIEELETINEEQQATNEELLASNEELQSTNEEMQSVNEELYTVNAEYQSKIEELVHLNEDMDNLLRSTNIGVVFLDRNLNIRKFTPAAAEVVNLRKGDIDRPISDFTSRLSNVDLGQFAQTILDGELFIEKEVFNSATNESLLLRAYPYIKADEELDGVVLTFLEVTELKDAQRELLETNTILETVYETSEVGFALHDEELRFVRINKVLAQINHLPVEDHIGKRLDEILPSDIGEEAFAQHRKVLETGEPVIDYQFEGTLPTKPGIYRYWSASYFPVELHNGRRWVAAIVNEITNVKSAQMALQRSQSFAHQLSESNPGIIYIYDVKLNKNVYLNSSVESILGYLPAEIEQMGDRAISTLLHPEDFCELRRYFDQFSSDPTGVLETEVRVRRKAGTWCWLALRSVVFSHGDNGEPTQILGLCTDITLRKETEVRLQKQKQALEDAIATAQAADSANQAKSEFLANMSHEIRTPMNLILGTSQLLERTNLNDRQRTLLEVLCRNGQTLLTLINDVLDLSKLEAHELKIEIAPFDLPQFLHSIIADFKPSVKDKGLEMRLDADNQLPELVIGDSFRIKQVLGNLLSNAVKFTREGYISLGVHCVEKAPDLFQVRFSVTDTGIGIDLESQEKLFEPFIQADNSSTRQYGGTGLGLTISRRLVELMSGEIGVESELGEGTTFWFTINLKLAEADNALQPATNGPGSNNEVDNKKSIRLLVAEDNTDNRDLAVMMLEGIGYTNITTAENGEEALAKTGAEYFDLILMDCQMPIIDGYEATKRFRQQKKSHQQVPVIALTAHAMRGDREKCIAAGMNDYISKPFSSEELQSAIERCFQAAQETVV